MNSYERIMRALRLEEPDMVPILEWIVEDPVIQKIMPGATMLDFYEKFDIDAITVYEDIEFIPVSPGIKRDHFGVLRNFQGKEGDLWFPFPIEPLIKEDMDPNEFLESYKMPDPHDTKRLATLRAAVKRFKGKKAIIFGLHHGLIYPAFIRGFGNYLADFYLNPDFVKRLATMVNDYYLELERQAIEIGADIIHDGEDYCGKEGLFMSIEHFKEFVLPGLRNVIKVSKENGVPFVKHTDGNVWPILDILVEEGIDAINPIEPAAGMDIGEVKRKYGDRIALIGNIDCAHLLTFGKPSQIRDAVRECIRAASPGGGHILSSSNSIHVGVPPENFIAMVEATREFGKYPIKV